MDKVQFIFTLTGTDIIIAAPDLFKSLEGVSNAKKLLEILCERADVPVFDDPYDAQALSVLVRKWRKMANERNWE